MDPLDLARWQFAIVTVYHFLFVPITIGLSAIVASYETAWVRTRNPKWLRLTKFFGKLFLINFAIGVVTGIVQEFQFGMNWSDYSRFVGDIFGAPLAIEGLLAFFLESTFLGLWIFGWDRLPAKLHAACIWIVHVGTLLSAYFILAANSWMQHPVGYAFNPDTGRAELNDFGAVLLNKVQLVTFPHTVLAAYMTGAAFVVGIAFWHLVRATTDEDREMFRRAVRTGAVVVLVSGLGVAVVGRHPGQDHDRGAADEDGGRRGALHHRAAGVVLALHHRQPRRAGGDGSRSRCPNLLSFLATGSTTGEVVGIDELRAQYKAEYGSDPGAAYYSPGDYTPIIPMTYWSFRLMIGLGLAAAAIAAWILWATRRERTPTGRVLLWLAMALPFMPLFANSFGWIFTEMGRQPWAVFGLMTTANAVSPGVPAGWVLTSLVAFTLLYGVLAFIEVRLMLTYIRRGADPISEDDLPPESPHGDPDRPLAFAY